MNNIIIFVNQEPYCIWGIDLKERNLEFINSVNSEYFKYLVKVHYEKADEKDDKSASLSLRIGYYHALETFFSLIGAFLQAPDCVYAWISKCSIPELRKLIARINQHDSTVFTKLNIKNICWQNISDLVFRFYLPNTEKSKKTKEHFANLWQRLSHEFLDRRNIDEYNSFKHGFRIKSGGFGLKVGVEQKYGVSPPEEEMKTVGYSQYGTSFYCLEKIVSKSQNNRSFRSRRVFINWKIEKIVLLLQLITLSIENIISILKIINGINAKDVKFYRLTEDIDFEKPWSFTSGITNASMDFIIEDSMCKALTKKEILDLLAKEKC